MFFGAGLAAMLLKRLPWIYFAPLSSFYWYLLVNFKSYVRSAGFSSSWQCLDNQAWPISYESALLQPFILWSRLILTRWQEDVFGSTCSLSYASIALCGFYMDSSNHTGAQRYQFISWDLHQLFLLPQWPSGHISMEKDQFQKHDSVLLEITVHLLPYLCCSQ